jgi:putative toxin-antitoxin system antitoxin component (TIGR02293 family)
MFDTPQIDEGLPWQAFERFAENIGLRLTEVAELISLPQHMLARRKAEGRLQADESERLLRLARIFARALELFDGDHDAATEWLTTRKIALGNAVPLERARTDIGAMEVDRLIGRLEHGIFS